MMSNLQMGLGQCHVTYFLNFWIPTVMFSVCQIGNGKYYTKNGVLPKSGRGEGHMTDFFIF